MRAVTGVAATNVITTPVRHGYTVGEQVVFKNLAGGAGLANGTTYYVIASGLTDRDFIVSETEGGSAFDFTTNITAGYVRRFHAGGIGAARHGLRGN